jgi:hypothetical protein
MNKTKAELNKQHALLTAREQSREDHEIGMLRPHGKLWGMDVFTWFKPSKHELENTINAFPFPTIWFGSSKEMNAAFETSEEWHKNISLVCVYNSGKIEFVHDISENTPSILACADINDGLEILKNKKKSKSVLLFTADGEQWKEFKAIFENYLRIHQ